MPTHGKHGPVGPRRPARWPGWAIVFPLLVAGLARAAELPPAVTLDLPLAANQATPSWLGHPETPATAFASLDLPILTPDPRATLLVTVYFQEKQGGFLRIIWNGTQGAQTLSDNFYEDIGMANQRSLLITPSTLIGDGTLIFQCGDTALGIQRIKLEWLDTRDALVTPSVHDQLVTPGTLPTQSTHDFDGQGGAPQPGAWVNQICTVPIQDEPLRIEQGVEFSIDLDKVPVSARLALKETGLPLGLHLVAWINGERAGTITPSVPDLLDSGYLTDPNAKTNYIGWRDGSFYVPVSVLKAGTNTIQLSDEDDTGKARATTTVEPPLAVKAMTMQLNYTPVDSPPGFLPPHLSLLPTDSGPIQTDDGPIPPWKTDSTLSPTTTP